MSLNIKNESTHRQVRLLARLTGETMTEAVDRAVAERLDRLSQEAHQARIGGETSPDRTRVR